MPARHAILGLLMEQPLHGYDIDGEFDKGLRAICHVNISQIYAYLKSMEERGWVESEVVLQKSSPPKKVFHVTDKGRTEMDQWLRKPIKAEKQLRDELLTKILFCWKLAPETLPQLVDTQIEIHKERLDNINEQLEGDHDFINSLLLDAARRQAEADYEWLVWVRDQLQDKGKYPVNNRTLAQS